MRAITLNDFGNVDNFEIIEIPPPEPAENELLIEVKAIGINPADVLAREAKIIFSRYERRSPLLLGWDVSGVVVKVGRNVQQFREGDQVFGMINFPGYGAGYAEFVCVPWNQFALKPGNISHEEAAGAGMAALAAFQGLFINAKQIGRAHV